MRDTHFPGRSPVYSMNGMAATSHPLATKSATDLLSAGGNAIDAAISAAAVLAVVESHSTGIGGDLFCLYRPSESKNIIALNASGKSPDALSIDKLDELGIRDNIPFESPHAVSIPAGVAGWVKLIEDHGTLSIKQILKPAIEYAEKGYVVADIIGDYWEREFEKLSIDNDCKLEDKIKKFANKKHHQIFLEPEGLNDHTIYPNGISTSLPKNVQAELLNKINGLEHVKIIRPGYAIEYDYVDPLQLSNTLETNKINNLYLAGQINGTTGYEEAAAQGIIAGINAALKVLKKDEFVLSRSEAYIGVLIDDLVNKGVTEPYRMFTSRAEYRLLLRSDNADLRLTSKGILIGCVSKSRNIKFNEKQLLLKKIDRKYKNMTFSPNNLLKYGIKINLDGKKRNIFDLLVFKNIDRKKLENIWPKIKEIPNDIFEELETKSVYKGYVERQLQDISDLKKDEELKIPKNIDYKKIPNLTSEALEKLNYIKPKNLGEIIRISGVTPAAVINILRFVNKKKTNYSKKNKWAV